MSRSEEQIFRDQLQEYGQKIYSDVQTREMLLKISPNSQTAESQKQNIKRTTELALDLIEEANKKTLESYQEKKGKEKSAKENTKKIAESAKEEVKNLNKQIRPTLITQDLSSLALKTTCIMCRQDRTLYCFAEHDKLKRPIRKGESCPFGPISFGSAWIITKIKIEEKGKTKEIDKLEIQNNFFEAYYTDNFYRDKLFFMRMGVIKHSLKTLNTEECDLQCITEINRCGVMTKRQYSNISKNEKATLAMKIMNSSYFDNNLQTDAIEKTSYIADADYVTIVKPNCLSIIKQLVKPDGNSFVVATKVFVFVRRVKLTKNKISSEFIEPVYVRLENKDFKCTIAPVIPDGKTPLVRVFYLAGDKIKGILCRQDNLNETLIDISSELKYYDVMDKKNEKGIELTDKEKKEAQVLPVLDRHTGMKLIFVKGKYDEVNLKEYKLEKSIRESLKEMTLIKEDKNQVVVRYKTNADEAFLNKMKERYPNFMEIKKNESNDVKMNITLENSSTVEEIEMIGCNLLFKLIANNICEEMSKKEKMNVSAPADNKKSKKKKGAETVDHNQDISTYQDFEEISAIAFNTTYDVTVDDGSGEPKIEFISVKEVINFNICTEPYKTLSDMKPAKEIYSKIKGYFTLKENPEGGYNLEINGAQDITTTIMQNPIGKKQLKDIVRTTLVNTDGHFLGEIEQKHQFINGKSSDNSTWPVSEFTIKHQNKIYCDIVKIEEFQVYRQVTRAIVTGENSIVISETIEPNVRFILSYRIGNNKENDRIANIFCKPSDFKELPIKVNSEVVMPEKPSEGHKSSCIISQFGQFAIRSKVKIMEKEFTENDTEIALDLDKLGASIKKIENRDEARVILIVCESCQEADVILENYDHPGDPCSFNVITQRLSHFDFLTALAMLKEAAKYYPGARKNAVVNRYKHRLQRNIFNTVYNTKENDSKKKAPKKK